MRRRFVNVSCLLVIFVLFKVRRALCALLHDKITIKHLVSSSLLCTITVIDCKPLTPITFGTIKYLQNTTYIGSSAVYSCASSHRLNGNTQRMCLETGLWSDLAPKCEEIRCNEPIIAEHSIVSVTGNDRMYGRTIIRSSQDSPSSVQTYRVGASAKYRCERGYKIIGDPLITCEDNGSWGGHVPECVCECLLDFKLDFL